MLLNHSRALAKMEAAATDAYVASPLTAQWCGTLTHVSDASWYQANGLK